MCKILNGLFPDIMQNIFETKNYMAPKIWDLVRKEIKQVTTLNEFKAKIKIWKLENCLCRFCRTYLILT